MSNTWVRQGRPEKRRVVLLYKTAEAKNKPIEDLLERIPYGQVNKTLLECLRIGTKAMLASIDGMQGQSGAPSPGGAPPQPAPPANNQGSAQGGKGAGNFSKAAARHFEQFGGPDKKAQ